MGPVRTAGAHAQASSANKVECIEIAATLEARKTRAIVFVLWDDNLKCEVFTSLYPISILLTRYEIACELEKNDSISERTCHEGGQSQPTSTAGAS